MLLLDDCTVWWSCYCACHEDTGRPIGTAPLILNLATRWRWLFFKPQGKALYRFIKNRVYPMPGFVGLGKYKISYFSRIRTSHRLAHSLAAMPVRLFRLRTALPCAWEFGSNSVYICGEYSVLLYQTTRRHIASPWDPVRNYFIKTQAVSETPHNSPLWRHYALDAGRNDWCSSLCWFLHVWSPTNCFARKNYINCFWRWLSEVFLIRGEAELHIATVRLFLKTYPESYFFTFFFTLFQFKQRIVPYFFTCCLVSSVLCILIHEWGLMILFHTATRWRSWLRNCATNQKFARSIPDGVTRIFFIPPALWPWARLGP